MKSRSKLVLQHKKPIVDLLLRFPKSLPFDLLFTYFNFFRGFGISSRTATSQAKGM